jgi:hypothetical protein
LLGSIKINAPNPCLYPSQKFCCKKRYEAIIKKKKEKRKKERKEMIRRKKMRIKIAHVLTKIF